MIEEQQIKAFCDNYGLKSLIRQPACYESPSNPTCIDLIVTNAPQKFQSPCVLETGLSDLMTLAVVGKIFKKLKPRIINYRFCKHFTNETYRESLLHELSKDSCSLSHQSKFLNIYSKLTNIATDAKIGLQEMKRNSPDKLILGHLNINSVTSLKQV